RTVEMPVEAASSYCITDQRVMDLARCGISVERVYGSPQDIEWAAEGGHIYLLQARPITRITQQLQIRPDHDASKSPRLPRIRCLERWKSHFGDHFPDPLTPMDLSVIVETALEGIGAALRQVGLNLPVAENLIRWTPDGAVQLCPQPPRPGP